SIIYVNGIVLTRTSSTQFAALDAATGVVLWQYSGTGKNPPRLFVTLKSLFIADEDGVKEYESDKAQRVPDEEVLAELANAFLSKGNREEAANFAGKLREIDPTIRHYDCCRRS